jgi:hypothetical protein
MRAWFALLNQQNGALTASTAQETSPPLTTDGSSRGWKMAAVAITLMAVSLVEGRPVR